MSWSTSSSLLALVSRLRRPRERKIIDAVSRRHLGAVAAVLLRAVERGVGGGEEGLGAVACDERRDAAARARPDRAERDPADLRPQPLGELNGSRQVRLRQDGDELLASPARDGVALARARVKEPGHLAQQPVAGGVAVGVVDPLEVVEVEEDDGELV